MKVRTHERSLRIPGPYSSLPVLGGFSLFDNLGDDMEELEAAAVDRGNTGWMDGEREGTRVEVPSAALPSKDQTTRVAREWHASC